MMMKKPPAAPAGLSRGEMQVSLVRQAYVLGPLIGAQARLFRPPIGIRKIPASCRWEICMDQVLQQESSCMKEMLWANNTLGCCKAKMPVEILFLAIRLDWKERDITWTIE